MKELLEVGTSDCQVSRITEYALSHSHHCLDKLDYVRKSLSNLLFCYQKRTEKTGKWLLSVIISVGL